MAQQNIKQIKGATQGSVLFLGVNGIVSEDYDKLNWYQGTFSINGNLKINDGNQQSGYFLSTDGNGLARWSPGSTVSEINDLSDVNTNLPTNPSVADDGRLIYYSSQLNEWITSDSVNHGTVVINAKTTGGTIPKGTPLYLIGFDSDIHTVGIANAGSSTTMPVIGFASEDLDNTNPKHVITFGKIQGIDTTSGGSLANGESWSINDDLYMSSVTGELTNVRPVGVNTRIQRIAKVLKVSTSGQLFIYNTARTAGLPNLEENNVWIGDNSNHPVSITFSFDNLTNVNIISATTNDTLRYDGSNWVNNSFITSDSSGTFSVNGTFKYTDGNQQSGYVLTSDANGLASWTQPQTSGSGVTGSGTTNYFTKWDSVDTISSTSLIYSDGNGVGFGTTSTSEMIDVDGNVKITGQIYVDVPATLTPSTNSQVINWNDGTIQIVDLGSAPTGITFSFTNPKAGGVYTIQIIQGANLSDITWPGSSIMKWEGGTSLTPTGINDAIDLVTMVYNGSYYLASYVTNFS